MDIKKILARISAPLNALKSSPEEEQLYAHKNEMIHISVTDPGTQKSFVITSPIITGIGGDYELSGDMRQHLLATKQGQIFFSHAQKDNPRILSIVSKLRLYYAAEIDVSVHTMDMSTIAEFYRKEGAARGQAGERRVNDSSRMQRELVAIVANAASQNSSDIHIIVNQNRAVVRFRIDGVIREVMELPPQYAFELLPAAFAMADASDTAYQSLAYQAARVSSLKAELPSGVQSLRLQFNPLANDGRYLIARILYSGEGKSLNLETLGYNTHQVKQIATMSARPVGINIVSGPTGSGKSTTLKAVLERLITIRRGEVNILTIEDPPEYVIDMAQQMPVTNAKTQDERNAAFTQAISAGLRSDPDILMIGEIRDRASADLAVEGALSGHPIYASVHANTAMDILLRLRDMGIEDFKVYDHEVFSGLIGQRLVRKLCGHCRVKIEDAISQNKVDELVVERIENMLDHTPAHLQASQLYFAGDGCNNCNNGYKGRSVVSEIILPDAKFMNFMRQGHKSDARAYWMNDLGGIDLLGNAWIRALSGDLSPADIENTIALLSPTPEHITAIAKWGEVAA